MEEKDNKNEVLHDDQEETENGEEPAAEFLAPDELKKLLQEEGIDKQDFEVIAVEEDEEKEKQNAVDINEEEGTEQDIEEDDAVIVLSGHEEPVYAVAIHQTTDGFTIATGGGDDVVRLWHWLSDDPVAQELRGHKDSITCCAFSQDGSFLASGSMDGEIKIWNVKTNALERDLEGPTESIEWFKWHSRGNVLLCGSSDGTMWMYLAATGQCMNVFSGHTGAVLCGTFTADGKGIVSGGDDGSLRYWDPKTGVCLQSISPSPIFHEGPIGDIALSNVLEDIVVSGSHDGSLCVSNYKVGKILSRVETAHSDSIESLAMVHAQPLVASGSLDGSIKLWDLHTMQIRAELRHDGGVTKLLAHPSQSIIYSSSVDKTVRVWDTRSCKCIQTLSGHMDVILDLASSKDGKYVVSGSDDGTARVFIPTLPEQ